MIPPDVSIVGVASVAFDAERAEPWLRLVLSDGSIAATWWPVADLAKFAAVVTPLMHRPPVSSLQ